MEGMVVLSPETPSVPVPTMLLSSVIHGLHANAPATPVQPSSIPAANTAARRATDRLPQLCQTLAIADLAWRRPLSGNPGSPFGSRVPTIIVASGGF